MSEVKEAEQYIEINPAEVEAQLVAEAQNRHMDPMEMASQMYGMYVPHYKNAVDKLSVRATRRILNFLVLYPFEQADVKAATEEEQQLMQLCNSLIEAKFVMTMAAYNENAQKVYEAQNTPLTSEEEAEVVKEFKKAGLTDEEIGSIHNKGE